MINNRPNVLDDLAYVGVMSGTSMDNIDAAVVRFKPKFNLVAHHSLEISPALKARLQALIDSKHMQDSLVLDVEMGRHIANAVCSVIEKAGLKTSDILAIGSHGQTIWHAPNTEHPYTLQIGNPNIIANTTNINTIADFRMRDMASGGQGAPLVPVFHKYLFQAPNEYRAIVNIGGIANITLLPTDGPVSGFDCGPGNTLLDYLAQKHLGAPYDHQGQWSQQGQILTDCLEHALSDSYFQQPPPKSTGLEWFNQSWIDFYFRGKAPIDVARTLVEVTAQSIAKPLLKTNVERIIICGGGGYNKFLIERLKIQCPNIQIDLSDCHGIDIKWVEAAAFAWLAYCTLNGTSSALPSVTGASKSNVLGGIYPGEHWPLRQ